MVSCEIAEGPLSGVPFKYAVMHGDGACQIRSGQARGWLFVLDRWDDGARPRPGHALFAKLRATNFHGVRVERDGAVQTRPIAGGGAAFSVLSFSWAGAGDRIGSCAESARDVRSASPLGRAVRQGPKGQPDGDGALSAARH